MRKEGTVGGNSAAWPTDSLVLRGLIVELLGLLPLRSTTGHADNHLIIKLKHIIIKSKTVPFERAADSSGMDESLIGLPFPFFPSSTEETANDNDITTNKNIKKNTIRKSGFIGCRVFRV